jgi:hypothetical protein
MLRFIILLQEVLVSEQLFQIFRGEPERRPEHPCLCGAHSQAFSVH